MDFYEGIIYFELIENGEFKWFTTMITPKNML